MKYITSEEARRIDDLLLTKYKYTIEQLIEAAGLCIYNKLTPHLRKTDRILVVCGPGNNGGDGLVLARYLHNNSFNVTICLPWGVRKDHLRRMMEQCSAFGVRFCEMSGIEKDQFDVGIDAIYGFGYKPPLKEDVSQVLRYLMTNCRSVVSIDVPTGWEVDSCAESDRILKPHILVSMTAPKICAKSLDLVAIHIIVDEFIPRKI